MSTNTVTVATLAAMKERGEKIAVVTAYDYPSALYADRAGVDAILVGDSLGMVVLGYATTLPVTMEDMLHHVRAVVRGATRCLVIADMPFLSYQAGQDEAVVNAGRLLKDGAGAVKVEGGASVAPLVRRLVDAGIPVMGHLGMTPQSVRRFGGWRVQGKTEAAARELLDDARRLQDAGAFGIVLEMVPVELSEAVSNALEIPTIGIGAGVACDGQVQVLHDILGLFDAFLPRHARRYAQLGEAMQAAVAQYTADVRSGGFPAEENTSHAAVLEELWKPSEP